MKKETYGFTGRLLRVNLGREEIKVEEPDDAYYKHYLGGRGIIVHTLLNEVPARIDPLGSENKLIFAAGLLTGHKLIGMGRCSVGAKSPLSGGYGEAEAGGFWGVGLRMAGYDAIIIEGAAKNPVYLKIDNEGAELRDAGNVWGLEVKPAKEWLQAEVGPKYRTAIIGPGGERQTLFANIIVDCIYAFGRGGMGAVMGSKNLKAIVVKGEKALIAADPEKLVQLNRIMGEKCKTHPNRKFGTGGNMKAFLASGNLPIRNFAGGVFPGVEKTFASSLMEKYGTGMESCFNCPIRCKKKIRSPEGPWKTDVSYGGPEYETLAAFGSNLLIDNVEAICKAHEICNRFGLDTISMGGTIAFAMDCFENGILTVKDLDGLELNFGNAEAMVSMVEKIAVREGIGNLLAQGSKRAAEAIGKGAIQFAMQVKGLEIAFHEPRYKQGLGLHYSTHATGADHCSGIMDDVLPGMMKDWESLNISEIIPAQELSPRKARMVYELGRMREGANHLGYCILVPWTRSEIQEAIGAVTGWPGVTSWKLMKAVERGITLMRIFNLREGFSRLDDKLPGRFFNSPVDGPLKQFKFDDQTLNEVQEIYYEMMGWDNSGVPTKGTLAALDIEWASPYLTLQRGGSKTD
jgi:aldehyde:ferredoxin oxidoreductase